MAESFPEGAYNSPPRIGKVVGLQNLVRFGTLIKTKIDTNNYFIKWVELVKS